ncbi:MAG TPA: glycosyltransferase family 39 protein [Bacillota bacterium]
MGRVVAVVVLALLIRAAACVAGMVPEPPHDAIYYDLMVRQLLGEGVFGYKSEEPNAYVTPGYPLFLAALYSVFGWREASPVTAVLWVQVVLDALTAGLIVLAGRRLGSRRAGVVAGVAWALYPGLVFLPLYLLTETLFLFLLVLLTLVLLRAVDESGGRSGRWWAAVGGLAALVALVRPVAAPLLGVTWLWEAWRRKRAEPGAGRRASLARVVLISGAAFVAVMLPWWIRNALVLGEVVLLATQTGNPLLAGAFPAGELPRGIPTEAGAQLAFALQAIVRGFAEQPAAYLYWFTVGKLLRLLGSPFYTPAYRELAQLVHFLTVPVGLWGMIYRLPQRPGHRPGAQLLAWLAVAIIGLHLPFVPENRFALSSLPWLFLLGGLLVDDVLRAGEGGGFDEGSDRDSRLQ